MSQKSKRFYFSINESEYKSIVKIFKASALFAPAGLLISDYGVIAGIFDEGLFPNEERISNLADMNFFDLFIVPEQTKNIISLLKTNNASSFIAECTLFNEKSFTVTVRRVSEADASFLLLLLFPVISARTEILSPESIDLFSEHFAGANFFWVQTVDPANKIEFYSSRAKEITGYSSDELCKMPHKMFHIVQDDDRARIMKNWTDFANNSRQDCIINEYRIAAKDGSVKWLRETVVSKYHLDKSLIGYFGFVSDITKEKHLADSLQLQIDELIAQSNSKDRFINILSHDLRSPFTSILGFSEILLNENSLTESEKLEYLKYIHEASENQLQFVNYLLDWSRLRMGTIRLEASRIRVQDVIYNAVSALTGNAIRKNIEISVTVAENLFVKADERLLSQVIVNLLGNALKFSFENSSIEILADRYNERQAEIVVRDYGTGISPGDRDKIFTVEKIISKEGTKGERGSGFGLTLVKEIIQKHHGEIWFYTEEGKGSEFHFTLPIHNEAALIISDNDDDREFFLSLLRQINPALDTYQTDNGFDALEMLTNYSPNFIILRHQLPLMDAFRFIEQAGRQIIPFSCVYLDEYNAETEAMYLSEGVEMIISKPFHADHIKERITHSGLI